MALIAAKCPQCGGDIQVDDSHEAGICKYCNTPFVTEKVINNYYTTNNISIQNATINVQGINVENLKKLGDEKLKTSHYPFEIDEYAKAGEYFARVLEYEDTPEYKLKYDLCNDINNLDRLSTQNVVEIIDKVFIYIQNDVLLNDYNQKRIMVYADLVLLMENVISAATMYYYERYKTNSLYPSVYISLHLSVVRKKLELGHFMAKYSDVNKISDVIIQLCKSCEGNLASIMPFYVPSVSEQECEKIKELALKTQNIGRNFESSYTVRDDILKCERHNATGGCYIATCVYGSYDCPPVWTLRRYRDYVLAKTWYGRCFIFAYYTLSPSVVKIFGNSIWFKNIWRKFLNKKIAKLRLKGYEDSPYND